LEPEAIESVFVLYRITGRPDLLESAWDIFTTINSTWGALNSKCPKHPNYHGRKRLENLITTAKGRPDLGE
jgi:hypothetical protein